VLPNLSSAQKKNISILRNKVRVWISMKIYLIIGALAFALGACAYKPTALPVATAQQAVTSTVFLPIRYQDPLAGYTHRSTTGPREWRSVNEEQTERK
jgi:hypothetical protein